MSEVNGFDQAIVVLQTRRLSPEITETGNRSLFAATEAKTNDEFIVAVIALITYVKTNITDVNAAANIKWYDITKWRLTASIIKQLINLVVAIVNSLIK